MLFFPTFEIGSKIGPSMDGLLVRCHAEILCPQWSVLMQPWQGYDSPEWAALLTGRRDHLKDFRSIIAGST